MLNTYFFSLFVSTEGKHIRHSIKRLAVDNKENNKGQSFQTDYNFLLDEDFISWRLYQTKESDEYWETFLINNPHLKESLEKAIVQFNSVKINCHQLPGDDKKEVYRVVLSNIHRYNRRRLLRKIGSVAAILVIGILSALFVTRKGDIRSGSPGEMEIIVGETLPEEEIYLISRGERINIAHKSRIGLTPSGKAFVIDSTDSSKEFLLGTAELNRLVVPYGKRTNLTLSDGTEIWLNSGTQLDFPSEFTKKTREVFVNGEIFIDVAHDPRVPFVVRAKDMDIRVQGTSFNISAYHDDTRKTVVLVEGKIEIETAGSNMTELVPNEKFEMIGSTIMKELVDVSDYVSWTKGILVFNEAPVSEILKKIGRYYNVQFESSPDIKLNDKVFSGKLFLSSNLDSVMTSVSALSSTVYQRENSIIRITKQ